LNLKTNFKTTFKEKDPHHNHQWKDQQHHHRHHAMHSTGPSNAELAKAFTLTTTTGSKIKSNESHHSLELLKTSSDLIALPNLNLIAVVEKSREPEYYDYMPKMRIEAVDRPDWDPFF
jgi:hypothetical protein